MNEQIASKVNLCEITVKMHRSHLMRKMAARTLADLVRKSVSLGVNAQSWNSSQGDEIENPVPASC
jgi:DNA-binding NarL/FixJ family response regulator